MDIIGYGSKHSHEFKLTLNEDSYDVSTNTSVVSYNFSIYKSSYSWSGYNNITYVFSINGSDFTGTIPSYSAGSRLTLGSGTMTVSHNDDGTKTVGAYFSVYDGSGASYCCGNASGSGNLVLTTIPRYTTLTISERSKTYNSISIDWVTSNPRDYTWYRVNMGSWIPAGDTVQSDMMHGYFTVPNLQESTQYKIEARVRRTDSQTLTESNALLITTESAGIEITTEGIDFGENAIVSLTNPSGSATTLVGAIGQTEIISQSISTGTNIISFTDEQLTAIFKEYGDISQDNTVTMTLTATASNGSQSSTNLVITFTGDRATVWVNDGTWKKGIVWAKDNGTWKKGIAWKGVNGTWKKAL